MFLGIRKELLDKLKETFPDRISNLKVPFNEQEVAEKVGEQRVIQFLEMLYNDQQPIEGIE